MTKPSSKLHVVTDAAAGTCPPPPRKLGKHGMDLWRSVQMMYRVDDAGGIELLAQSCEALDMVQDYRVQIERDGAVIRSKGGVVKDHPLLRHEMAARAFIARCIARLGLDVEALRATPGRPGGGIGYIP